MINISKLKEKDIGMWVQYHGSDSRVMQGRVKSWNNKFVFVVYHCNNKWNRFKDFTGEATNPKDLFSLKEEVKANG